MPVIIYRLLSPFIGLAYILRSLWAILRGTETFGDLAARFGAPDLAGPTVWIHGASVGEMNAARPVITALAAKGTVLVSATTLSGRATVRRWDITGVRTQLAPLDWCWITRRVLRRAQVRALIIIENELWPNRIITTHKAGLPVLMINARMSARSARTWGRFGNAGKSVLGPMALIAPQDADSAVRLQRLGGTNLTDPLNLKGLYAPTLSAIPPHLLAFERDTTILAAATHAGEETIVLQAFKALRQAHPQIRLIIAPRHPVRGQEVGALCRQMGFSTAFRSSDDAPGTDVYIADTLGDMHLWYRLSGAAFIGGSLVDKGGHTPFEPVAYGCPLVHGSHVGNFSDGYGLLSQAQGAALVTDAGTLARAFVEHLCDDAMAARAKQALDQPDLAPLLARITAALDPSPQPRL